MTDPTRAPWETKESDEPMMRHRRRRAWMGRPGNQAAWAGRRRRPGLLFLRLAGVFGFLALLVTGSLALGIFLLTRLTGGDGRTATLVWIGACGLLALLPLLTWRLGALAFRGFAHPLANLMSAADAVAAGDLSVRVPVGNRGPFGHLASAFNRMVTELQQADQRRRNLTADVAHELRTPLQIIQGNLEGVLDGVYEATPEHISATLDETRLLARLVEDLRVLSQAEAGQLPMNWEMVNLVELLGDVATSFGGQAEVAGISLRTEIQSTADALTVRGDVGRLDQVLSNLMVNALRYTPAGGTITLRATPVANGVRVQVADTGAGIPVEDLPFIFDRFWRGDRARPHAPRASSGLGLAIARQLVQAHGGRLTVESQVGQGTTFTIELPTQPAAPKGAAFAGDIS